MPERLVRWLIAIAATLLVTAGLQPQAAAPASAAPSADPVSVDFGNVAVNTTSTRTITITVDTGYEIEFIGGTGLSAPFNFGLDTCVGPFTGPGTCTVKEKLLPAVTGPAAGTLSIDQCPTGPGACVNLAIDLTGTGVHVLGADPASVDFGNVAVNTTSTRTITITVDTGYEIEFIGGTGLNAPFNFGLDTCIGPFAGPGTCTVKENFCPTMTGPAAGTLSIDECPTGPGACVNLAIDLTGTGALPTASLDHASLSFGDQGLSTTSDPQDVKVTNTGSVPLAVGTLSASGDFSLTSDGCSSQSVAPGDFCTVGVTFKPTMAGSRTGTLSVSDDAGDSPQQVALDGAGVAPTATFTPSSITFAQRLIGTTSPNRTVTLVNTSNVGMLFRKQSVTGDYAISPGGTCVVGGVVDAGDPCTVNVTFTPTAAETRDGALVLNTTATSSPHVIPLSGEGIAGTPGFSVNPTSVSFGNQRVGVTSTAHTVTVTNPGTGPLSLQSVSTSGSYARSGGTCASSLQPGPRAP